MSRDGLHRRWLRGVRQGLAEAIAAAVLAVPSLERVLIRGGRIAARRSRILGGLYWFAQERLLARLRGGGSRFRTVSIGGRPLELDITDATGRYPHFYGTPYEPAVTAAILDALGDGVFIDVGANIGYYTVLAAQAIGGGLVVAFEPHDGARQSLEELVRRNGVAAVVDIVPVALSDAEGEATLFVEDAITAHSTIAPELSPMRHVAALHAGAVVPTTTLDAWIAKRGGLDGRIRCIKIDVEGAEARVLGGMARLLQASGLRLICETSIGSEADAMLTAAGFDRRRIEPGASAYGNFLYIRP